MVKSCFCNLFAHSIQLVNYNHAFGICQLINMDKKYFFLVQCSISEIQKYTVGTESIQTPLNFSLIVILLPFAKII